jgi:hypothetical protein
MTERFNAVLFPGRIETSTERDLRTVLSNWIDSEGNLVLSPEVKVPPTRIEPATHLVFKRNRSTGETVFVGSLNRLDCYTQMADFHYTPPDPESHIHGLSITRQTQPQSYNFEGNPSILKPEGQSGAVAVLRFKDQSPAPTEATELIKKHGRGSDETELVERVKSLFASRPVWQRVSLEAALGSPELPGWRLANVIRQLAYLFADGPWRNCYVRFGYDPRADPASRPLQTIDFRDPFYKTPEGVAQLATGRAAEPVDIHFRRPPVNKSQLYQLVDIDDSGIRACLSGEQKLTTPDPHTGWLSEGEMDLIRNQMKIKSESMRRIGSTRQQN